MKMVLGWWALLCMASVAQGQQVVATIELPGGKTAQVTFTTVDVPGAVVTSVKGINATGEMVGVYGASNNGPVHGFLSSGGNITTIDYPEADTTVVTGINDSGLMVGYAEFSGGLIVHGFSYDMQTFTTFDAPGQPQTYASGINNAGQVVGGAGFSGSLTRAFEVINGQFRLLRMPGQSQFANGINSFGEVAGFVEGSATKGFAYKAGTVKPLVVPQSQQTLAWGVNDGGVLVGWYSASGKSNGFALINEQYVTLGYPGAKGTWARGINGLGQVVGEYTFDFIAYHGFVTTSVTSALLTAR
jgi:probable HAF family extracellular repeat protein